MDFSAIAKAVSDRMRQRNWSVEYVAARAGVSGKTVSDIRNAIRDNFKGQTLEQVAEALDWPRDALYRIGDGEQVPEELALPEGLVAAEFDRVNRRIDELDARIDRLLGLLEGDGR